MRKDKEAIEINTELLTPEERSRYYTLKWDFERFRFESAKIKLEKLKEKGEERRERYEKQKELQKARDALISLLFKTTSDFKKLYNVSDGYYLYSYHPEMVWKEGVKVNNPFFDENSQFILYDIKAQKKSDAINKTVHQLNNLLKGWVLFTICVVPSSDASSPSSGIRLIAKELCKNGSLDGTDCIKRKYTIPSQHKSQGRLGVDELKASLKIESEDLIKDKNVVLFDDISTSGASFESSRQLLLEKQAKNVICIALAHTSPDHNL